jgi:hypothetical protein
MSDDTPLVECSLCGRDGYPPELCDMCHGRAKVQSRAKTLSEERTDRKNRDKRYGRNGAISPKIVRMPGSDPSYGG